MTTHGNNPANQASSNHGHGDYERRDIGVAGVVYFLIGLVAFLVIAHFIVTALYDVFEKRSEAEQTPVNPLVTNAPRNTRELSVDYRDYLKQNFPEPQLEIDERNQLDHIRIDEEDTLSTYGYIDQKAGTVRIPIERAMELIAQRGLPTRTPMGKGLAAASAVAAADAMNAQTTSTPAKKKKNK
jgi:hypothetical protein